MTREIQYKLLSNPNYIRYLRENSYWYKELNRNNNFKDFIEDMKARHFEAHRGDWQTYLRNTVADWQQQPSLTDDEWKNINCPAFFINGENDPFGTCEELHEKVPLAMIYKVIGGSHHPHFVGEQIDEIKKMILDFLSGI